MFGELDDSNIYESFDAFSENNDGNNAGAEFSFGDSSDAQNDGMNEDFLDMSSYAEPSAQDQQQMPDQELFEQPVMGAPQLDGQQGYEQQAPQPQMQPAKKGGGGFFVILLLLVAVAAGGLFYYKKFMTPAPSQDNAAGDYFYDQAAQQGAAPTTQEQDANTATVDVNLDEQTQANAENPEQAAGKESPKDEAAQIAAEEEKLANDKSLSPQERAELKKKLDLKRENQFGFGSKKVTIPVAAGGRVDPFLPFNEKLAIDKAPKFDLIAPPPEVPLEDPVVDQVTQTKISGIMYDSSRPSAIVNIGGTDYLVHKGDNVNGFQILNITKNSVTIKYNANIYQATVGEEVGSNVQLNPVSNIANQFGGAYKKPPKNAIQF